MNATNVKTALVTGASAGMGKEIARQLIADGYLVYTAARRIEKMADLEKLGAIPLKMDITKEDDITVAVETITRDHGGVDVLINNAGYGSYGAIEDVPIDEARRQFEVNIFGLARLTQLVLPGMREKRYGKIVNISSMGGKIYTPFGGWYHATKHALEGFSDCLRLEAKPFGIDVIVIEPGGIKTDWGAIAAENLKKTSGGGAYAEKANAAADSMAGMYASNKLSDSSVIVNAVSKAISVKNPKTRYVAGSFAKPMLFIRKWFGDKVFDKIVMSQVK